MITDLSELIRYFSQHQQMFFMRVLPFLCVVFVLGIISGFWWGIRVTQTRLAKNTLAEHWIHFRLRSLEEQSCPVCGQQTSPNQQVQGRGEP